MKGVDGKGLDGEGGWCMRNETSIWVENANEHAKNKKITGRSISFHAHVPFDRSRRVPARLRPALAHRATGERTSK